MPNPGRSPRRKTSLPKLIEKYYADLADLARQNVLFEMGLRQPFHSLLAAAGKEHGWTLIAEQEKKVGGKTIRPDGTFKDEMNLVRGYWEAKDTADKLDAEIKKKQTAGYPLNNIIFEDTQTAKSSPARPLAGRRCERLIRRAESSRQKTFLWRCPAKGLAGLL
jgi:hypothetical protein